MPETRGEPFSNPIAPPSFNRNDDKGEKLTNDDFRRMLMTPKSSSEQTLPVEKNEKDNLQIKRPKKKSVSFFGKANSEDDQWKKEIASKYRDRAKERRDGTNDDYQNVEAPNSMSYRTIGPLTQPGDTTADRRLQEIQESKYLGGDMEHTHLVKGLDFALLQKVREQIVGDDDGTEQQIEEEEQQSVQVKKKPIETEEVSFRTRIAKNVYNIVFKSSLPARNEFFVNGRMAYAIELNDDEGESDIPTTIIRSNTDCQTTEAHKEVSTNDIVINKLTQILTHLRQGIRNKKAKKKDKSVKDQSSHNQVEKRKVLAPEANFSIFDDIENEYVCDVNADKQEKKKTALQSGTYFRKPVEDTEINEKDLTKMSSRAYVKKITEKFAQKETRQDAVAKAKAKGQHNKSKQGVGNNADYYAECYPGAMEVEDGMMDSDEEADYTKMDMGNKKGPVGRWDFENEEDYNKYMEKKEALPKAAFQFGIKMSEGRKTRRHGVKDEKAKLDREWQQISNIIKKRKEMGTGGHDGGHSKKVKQT